MLLEGHRHISLADARKWSRTVWYHYTELKFDPKVFFFHQEYEWKWLQHQQRQACDGMDRASDLDIYDLLQKVGFQEKTRKTDGREGSQSVLLVNWSVTICPVGILWICHQACSGTKVMSSPRKLTSVLWRIVVDMSPCKGIFGIKSRVMVVGREDIILRSRDQNHQTTEAWFFSFQFHNHQHNFSSARTEWKKSFLHQQRHLTNSWEHTFMYTHLPRWREWMIGSKIYLKNF